MSRWHELSELWRFRKLADEAKRVVLYAEHEGYQNYFEGLINELINSRQQSICYVTSDPDDPVLHNERPRQHTFYINKLLPYFLQSVKCRVMVMTMPDLGCFHLKRSLNPVHYVYLFHSMVSTHMMYRAAAFDHYDSILCVGPHHLSEIRANEQKNKLPAKELVEAGYYRLERIHNDCRRQLRVAKDSGRARKQTTILVAPSWGPDHLLATCGVEVIRLLLAEQYRVIVRPHSETVRREPELIASLDSEFNHNPDFELELSVAGDESLLSADLLVCDLSGVALEYALATERPVLFIDVPYKIKNDNYHDLGIEPIELALRNQIGEVMSPDKLSQMPMTIKRMLANPADYRVKLAELREKLVFNFGQSQVVAADHIMQLLDRQPPT